MKYLLFFILLLLSQFSAFAQNMHMAKLSSLPIIKISANVSLHFLSPEDINYADLSTGVLKGDLPVKNILRVKLSPDSSGKGYSEEIGVVTIVGTHFIAQFRLQYAGEQAEEDVLTQIEITPEFIRPLDISGISLGSSDFKSFAISMLKLRKSAALSRCHDYDISMSLNQVFSAGDYVFLDVNLKNSGSLEYDIDELRFSLKDKRINKATSVQSIELKPVWQLYPLQSFVKNYRNIFVFKKLSYPGHKVLAMSISEKQISGRSLELSIPYSAILKADRF